MLVFFDSVAVRLWPPPSQDSSGFPTGFRLGCPGRNFLFHNPGGHWWSLGRGRNTQAVAAPKSFQGLGAFLKTLKLPSDHPLHVYLPHALGHLGSSKRGQFRRHFVSPKSNIFLSLQHAHVAQQHPGSHSCHKKNGCFQK